MNRLSVFVVMPFSARTEEVWRSGILAACQALGWDCLRADMISAPGFVVPQIYDAINEADVIVGEMSDRNPNVFYEIGFAHALGKPTILLAASGDDLNAFDTQGFRHFLHGGAASRAREALLRVLPEFEKQISLEPMAPQALTLYEWPSARYPLPRFGWTCAREERFLQMDVDGGQRILETPALGPIISVSNTADLWNHRRGHSIMKLAATYDLLVGDVLHLFIDGRCTGAGRLDFVGDGGPVNLTDGTIWVSSWSEVQYPIHRSSAWTRWRLTATVAPTAPGYDLSRGTAVYLMTRVEQGTVFIKKIRLVLCRHS